MKVSGSSKHSCYINHPFSGSRSNKGRDPVGSWFFCWCLNPPLSPKVSRGRHKKVTWLTGKHLCSIGFLHLQMVNSSIVMLVFLRGVYIFFFSKTDFEDMKVGNFIPVETGNGSIAMPPGCLRLVELAQQHQSNTTFAIRMAPCCRFCRRICSLPTVHWLSRDLCWF